ncbi:hypothetical protein B0H17DRAFT_1220137 [Mycena rosella]|uniref:Uncharacterized protein n=1 Tax=Mycena rosella TaxID=1033263 RepID=A0AAD7FF90_MYCRO|nr:hypothetical protein B0H17DRAFT_1220137 [Mycena rosella]
MPPKVFPSSAMMSGFVFVSNPRQLNKPSKVWVLDGEIYLGLDDKGEEHGLTLLLRYFNKEGYHFGEIGLYVLRGVIGQMRSHYDLGGSEFNRSDYSFVVDVQEMIPLHQTDFATSDADSVNSNTDNADSAESDPKEPVAVITLPAINASVPPYFTLCGLPFNQIDAKATFDMDPQQYNQLGRDHSCFPVSCWIADSPRYKDSKPNPFPGKYAQISGHLKGVAEYPGIKGSAYQTRFKMDVDNVTFLGYAPKGSTSSTPASSLTSQSQTPAAKRPAGSQAGTPSWLSKKKKGNDGNAAPSSSPGPR